jgi:hypothetical protein
MKLDTNNQKLMAECIQQEFSENNNFNNVNIFFEFFASSMVLKNYDLSDDEIINGLTGKGNDGGIDGFYLFINDELLTEDIVDTYPITRGSNIELILIQSKYASSFGEDALMKWKTVSSNLLSLEPLEQYKGRYDEKILDNFSLFGNIIRKSIRLQCRLHINYYYVTLGLTNDIHPNVIAQKTELEKITHRIYPSANINVNFIGADELMSIFNNPSDICVNLAFADHSISLGTSDLIALVNIGTYFKFITDETGKIRKRYFEANVRDYQGHNAVNKSIAETLSSTNNEDFWWLNNGVTILVSKLDLVTTKEVAIMNPEIVNGLQTSREIYNFFQGKPDSVNKDKRNILVRIIKPINEDSRDRIIFATNNQTNIPKYSLRVTDNIHLQIELYFKSRGLYYDRRKNYYRNQGQKQSDIIGVAFLAQCLISLILRKPDFARARPSTLLDDEEIYNQLYNKTINLEAYYKAAMIGRKIKTRINLSALSLSVKNDILYYVIYASIVCTLRKKEITFTDLINFNLELLNNDIISKCIDIVYEKYSEQGNSSRVAKSPKFIFRIDKAIEQNNYL